MSISGTVNDALPEGSIFADVAAASEFFENGSLGYSPAGKDCCYDGLELRTLNWSVRPLRVENAESSFFRTFPEGFIRAVEPGAKSYLEVDLERPIRQARWYKTDLLIRTDDSVELWTAGSGHRVLAAGLGPCPVNDGLRLHPHWGYFYPVNDRRINYKHGDHSMIFSME